MTAPAAPEAAAGSDSRHFADVTSKRRGGRPRSAECGTRSKYTTGCRCSDCTEANREYQREWAAKNPAARARHAETSARWARKNRDRQRETAAAWRERNRETIRAQQREYYAANRATRIASVTVYREREQRATVRTAVHHQLPWTADEDRQLTELYPSLSAGQVAVRLGRTAYGVRNRARVLGLSKRAGS